MLLYKSVKNPDERDDDDDDDEGEEGWGQEYDDDDLTYRVGRPPTSGRDDRPTVHHGSTMHGTVHCNGPIVFKRQAYESCAVGQTRKCEKVGTNAPTSRMQVSAPRLVNGFISFGTQITGISKSMILDPMDHTVWNTHLNL